MRDRWAAKFVQADVYRFVQADVCRFIAAEAFRSLSPPDGLSLTAAATLATLERSGSQRLTALAVREGVTQPAMTQLIARLQDGGLVRREADPADGRVVQVRLTDQGRDTLARRRAIRADRLAAILARISPEERAALNAALPAIDALTSADRDGGPAPRQPARPGRPVRLTQHDH